MSKSTATNHARKHSSNKNTQIPQQIAVTPFVITFNPTLHKVSSVLRFKSWTAYLVTIFSLILIGYHVLCGQISFASGICYLIFLSDLTGPITGKIGQFWSYNSKIKLQIWAVKNHSDSSIFY